MHRGYKFYSAFLILLLQAGSGRCQLAGNDSLFASLFLDRISRLQQVHEADFPAGMIPSYRASHHRNETLKNDDNIFYTGLVVFTLRYLYPELDKRSQQKADSIIAAALPLYERHRNKKGRNTYNYWQTDKPEIFPNAGLLNLFNKSQALPDDLDVTSIILLAKDETPAAVDSVHQLMQQFTGGAEKKAKSSLENYKNLPAYSTWFGKKMPIDFDFGVLTNVLYLVNKYGLTYSAADSASLQFIVEVVKNRQYLRDAALVAPSYNRPEILMYHLARLMAQKSIPELDYYKKQLVDDAQEMYRSSSNLMDRIILSTSLMRLGASVQEDTVFTSKSLATLVEENEFVFFVANMASMLPRPYNQLIGKTGIGKFYYYCPAYNYALLLENMVLKNKH